MEAPSTTRPLARGLDPAIAGKRAECDGGGLVAGGRYAARQEFAGTLTGEYMDHGDPAWRWYLMTDLTRKPEGYVYDSVWCESGMVFLVENAG